MNRAAHALSTLIVCSNAASCGLIRYNVSAEVSSGCHAGQGGTVCDNRDVFAAVSPPPIYPASEFPPDVVQYSVPHPEMPNVQRLGANLFFVSSPGLERVAVQQLHGDYCWAAIAQTILNYQRIDATQEQIVQQIHGDTDDDGDHSATLGQIVVALSGQRFDAASQRTAILDATPFETDPYGMIEDLSAGLPMLVGFRASGNNPAHVLLLASIQYSIGPNGSPLFHFVELWDPMPIHGGWKRISGAELKSRIQFAVRFRIRYA